MERIKHIVDEQLAELEGTLSAEQTEKVAKAIEKAVIRGMLEGHHRAVDVCNECGEAEQDIAHKIRNTIRQKNDALIANLSALR